MWCYTFTIRQGIEVFIAYFRFIFPIKFHQKYIRKAMLELESKADIIFKKSLKETKARKVNRNMSL